MSWTAYTWDKNSGQFKQIKNMWFETNMHLKKGNIWNLLALWELLANRCNSNGLKDLCEEEKDFIFLTSEAEWLASIGS